MPAGGGRDQVAAKLAAEGIDSQPSALAPCGLVATSGQPRASRLVRQGPIYLQDVASQAAALVPPPQPGERVVDLALMMGS